MGGRKVKGKEQRGKREEEKRRREEKEKRNGEEKTEVNITARLMNIQRKFPWYLPTLYNRTTPILPFYSPLGGQAS